MTTLTTLTIILIVVVFLLFFFIYDRSQRGSGGKKREKTVVQQLFQSWNLLQRLLLFYTGGFQFKQGNIVEKGSFLSSFGYIHICNYSYSFPTFRFFVNRVLLFRWRFSFSLWVGDLVVEAWRDCAFSTNLWVFSLRTSSSVFLSRSLPSPACRY